MQKTLSFFSILLIVSLVSFATITGCGFNPSDTTACEQDSDCAPGMACSGRFCYAPTKLVTEAKGGTEKTVATEPDSEKPEEATNTEPQQREESTTDASEPSTPDKPIPEMDTDNHQDPCAKLTTLGQECTVSGAKGICKAGTIQCVSGAEVCISKNKPGLEVCDGKDNNCNGDIDENLGQLTCGQGECRVTINKCQNGQETTCTPKVSKPETCNMKDDDCDGSIDEDVPNCCMPGETKACGSSTTGECKLGTRTCDQSRKWSSCTGSVTPINEICDGKDNDCNGLVDDGLPVLSCGPPGSACFNQVSSCANGKAQSCTQKSGTAEVCDGKDNDCDGTIDEGLPDLQCGNGPCKVTTKACVSGIPQTCTPNAGAIRTETCNSIDDNCDGTVDNVAVSMLSSDLNNCGRCGNTCPTPLNATPTCSAGKCGYTCKPGWRDLDGTGGCETLRSPTINDTNLVYHYDCESFSGTQILDKSGKGNHGAIRGVSIAVNAGLFGNACSFRKDHDIKPANNATTLSAQTFSMWTYTTSITNARESFFYRNDDSPTIGAGGGKWLYLFANSGSVNVQGPNITLKSYTHHLLTIRSGKGCAFINGNFLGCTKQNAATGTQIYIGRDPGSSPTFPNRSVTDSYIDEIWASSKPWSNQEILRYYKQARP